MNFDLDLVEELRSEALSIHAEAWRRADGGQGLTLAAALCDQAADEIDLLRKELAEAQTEHTDMMWQRRRAEEEALATSNDRLDDLRVLLRILGMYDGAQPLSPAEVRDKAYAEVRRLKALAGDAVQTPRPDAGAVRQ